MGPSQKVKKHQRGRTVPVRSPSATPLNAHNLLPRVPPFTFSTHPLCITPPASQAHLHPLCSLFQLLPTHSAGCIRPASDPIRSHCSGSELLVWRLIHFCGLASSWNYIRSMTRRNHRSSIEPGEPLRKQRIEHRHMVRSVMHACRDMRGGRGEGNSCLKADETDPHHNDCCALHHTHDTANPCQTRDSETYCPT